MEEGAKYLLVIVDAGMSHWITYMHRHMVGVEILLTHYDTFNITLPKFVSHHLSLIILIDTFLFPDMDSGVDESTKVRTATLPTRRLLSY